MLNNKQREILGGSIVKIAEYVLLTLGIGQVALQRFNFAMLFSSVIFAVFIYAVSMFILRKYEEVR